MRRVGWLMFGLAWVFFALFVVGMGGVAAGSFAWSELPLLARFGLVAMGICFFGTMLMIFGSTPIAALLNQRTRARGVPAQAIIVDIADTGQTINKNPVARLRLHVRPTLEPPFEAETELIVSRLALPTRGQRVQVKYDPATHAVAVDTDLGA
jgi:hypothetical protein